MCFWANSIDFRIQFTSKFWLGHIVGRNKTRYVQRIGLISANSKHELFVYDLETGKIIRQLFSSRISKKITRIILFHVLNSVHHALNTHVFVLRKHFVFVNKTNFSHCFCSFEDFNNFMRMQEWYLLRNVGYENGNSTQGKSLLCDVSCLKVR